MVVVKCPCGHSWDCKSKLLRVVCASCGKRSKLAEIISDDGSEKKEKTKIRSPEVK